MDLQTTPVPSPNPPPISTDTLDKRTQQKLSGEGGFWKSKFLWFLICLVLFTAGFGAWFVFGQKPTVEVPKVQLQIAGNETLPVSGDSSFRVNIKNDNSYALKDMRLELVYPSGVVYKDSVPDALGLSGNTFELPELPSGQNASIQIRVRMQANVGDTKLVKAILRYKGGDSSAVFSLDAEKQWEVVGGGLKVEVEGPGEAGNGELISYIFRYKNESDAVIDNARLVLQVPERFVVARSEPSASIGSVTWSLGRLEISGGGSVSVFGAFDGAELGQAQVFGAELQIQGQGGGFTSQAKANFATQVKNQPITITQELQNATKTVANAGDRVSYTIKFVNNTSASLSNLKISFKVDSKVINWADVRAEQAQISTGLVTWAPATSDQLSVIRPGERGSVQVELPILNPPVKDSSKNLTIVSNVTVSADEIQAPVKGNSLEVKIATKPLLRVGVELVSGANPPKVGQETVYKVTLSALNTSNEVKPAKVNARLPLGASSVVGSSLNSFVTVESSASRLTWDLGSLQAYAGSFAPMSTTNFLVKMVPTVAQAGEEVFLLTDITLTGTDVFTEKVLSVSASDISSDDAAKGSGRGRVVK